MGRGIGEFIQLMFQMLPSWALISIGVLLAVWLWPRLQFRMRNKQVKESIRRYVRAMPDERTELIERMLERAGDNPDLLEFAVREGENGRCRR